MTYWIVWDSQTQEPITWKDGQIKRFEYLKEANRCAERWNQKYGAVRYVAIFKSEDIKILNNPAPPLLDKF